MKVLLVDDEQKFALMLAKRLELRGIQADVFFSGEKALESLNRATVLMWPSSMSKCRESAALN
jgi:DNA-binding response OmpR family regulator